MSALLTTVTSITDIGTVGDISAEIRHVMKQINEVQKRIKNLISDASGDPRVKILQLKLMQATLMLLYNTLARLMEEQAKQKEKSALADNDTTTKHKDKKTHHILTTGIDTFVWSALEVPSKYVAGSPPQV